MTKQTDNPDRIHFPNPLMYESKPKPKVTSTAPNVHDLFPPESKNGTGNGGSYRRELLNLYNALKDEAIELGYGIGAVVVPKFAVGHPTSAIPDNWGIITGHNAYHVESSKYRTLRVRWMSRNKADSEHYPDELYLVHRAIVKEEVILGFELQDLELSEKIKKDENK